ncbi:hypothetical protein BTR23_25585 [Alkalihalophilus pseudofirmus]|nr:hypothetical protein BTR23_25585 [Alkalihalophilus pseudofirmus]
MASKQIDVGFLPPTTYVLAHDNGIADVLLQSLRFGVDEDGNWTDELVDYYNAMVVVREDSDIELVWLLTGQVRQLARPLK